ncbi:MAG: ABC transporter ATP-binding protein [Chloroflexi bacterium]|uniref:ABC transporter ATP-binding protein n=1 Tax=Candidatus Chlorohelix allophototropha TaxID=3003348 RepID=A0A8T7M5M7_9CHLR|nr:ABC transporter ATP-binding protein [Chloroflexota bacterium]WJW69281.1 ABC transporter ATP-binding protein/permease [Chloroflexota bacterium L227-S17]
MMGGGMHARGLMDREFIKPQRISKTLKRFAGYFKPYSLVLVIAITLVIISVWSQVMVPDLIGQAVDCYLTAPAAAQQGEGGSLLAQSVPNCTYDPNAHNLNSADRVAGLGWLVAKLLGLFLLGAIANGMVFFAMGWAGQKVLKRMRVDLFDHLHNLSLGFYSKHEVGDLMSRITNDSETIQQAISFALVNVMAGVMLIVWVIFNMLTKSLIFALICLTIVPFMIISTTWFSGQARKAFRRSRLQMGNVNAELQQSISGVREVQAFSREDENLENFRNVNAANRDANIKAVAFTSALAPTLEGLGYIALAIVTGVGGILLLRGQDLLGTSLSLGLVITFLNYIQRLNQPIQQISVLWVNIQSAIAGAERIFGLLDEKLEIVDKPNAIQMPPIKGDIVFEQVSAEYVAGETVLKNISFSVEAGKTIAIVGPTGAGKTTIINLIPRFYEVTSGKISIDGKDVRDVTAASLRRQIGIVLQDSFLFSDTVMNNIRFGNPSATDEEVKEAARLARADTFIENLPEGYNTVLGERGRGLSQGQRQLISIARAAMANPRILILDEATSSVDTRTERMIQAALEKLLQGRTSFVIAHRLSTIKNADQILVLKDGEIVERGNFQNLLDAEGVFYNLYMSQFRRQEAAA